MAPRKNTSVKRKKNLKTAKLEAFLDDFDSEVKARVGQMKERANQLQKDVDNSYNMALIKLPRAVRLMNWMEYYKCDKPVAAEVDSARREEEAAAVESVVAEDHAVLLKSVKKSSRKRAGTKSASDDGGAPATVKKSRAVRKPPTASKRTTARSGCRRNSSVGRPSRYRLITPARSALDSSIIGPTPLVTPRFDPRLPKTPAARVPRHKERVYSIAVNGCPIEADAEDIVVYVPVGTGESIQLLASQMDSVDLKALDKAAVRGIRMLQNRLTSLFGAP